MNWDAIAAIGEILGAVGVLLSLLYLSMQIRTNNKMLWSQSTYAQADQAMKVMEMQFQPDLRSALSKIASTDTEISGGDFLSLEAYFGSFLQIFLVDFKHFKVGLMDQDTYNVKCLGMIYFLSYDIFKQMWHSHFKKYHDAEFTSEIERLVLRAGKEYQAGQQPNSDAWRGGV